MVNYEFYLLIYVPASEIEAGIFYPQFMYFYCLMCYYLT
jgi:hypothetical protein